jgi:hypothetical protein
MMIIIVASMMLSQFKHMDDAFGTKPYKESGEELVRNSYLDNLEDSDAVPCAFREA